jgi:hypothetical protein
MFSQFSLSCCKFINFYSKFFFQIFEKHVVLDSLAVYWTPESELFSEKPKQSGGDDQIIDLLFDSNIGTSEKPVNKLKYLLGPISSEARLKWCSNPELHDFKIPQITVDISMNELGLSLSKFQYHDFMYALQDLEFRTRANKFRKYKARRELENVPNYEVKH